MNKDFKKLIDQLEPALKKLLSSRPIDISTIPAKPKLAGVYLFSEGRKPKPLYVGRTRNLRNRMKSHHNLTNPNKGSFAFLIAREASGLKKASYKKEGSRKALHASPAFMKHKKTANGRIQKMTIRFVEIEDANMQHIFEIYAAMKLSTPFNSFETH